MSGDPVANVLRARGRLTRRNYLNINYLGRPLAVLHPEAEEQLPDELRGPDDPPGGIHPINALLNDNPFLDLEFCKILSVILEGR